MAQDAREPYYDDTGSTHSVSTASDLHEQVGSIDRANWLADSLHRFLPFTTVISENEKCLSFVQSSWVDFIHGCFLNSTFLVAFRAGIAHIQEEYDRTNRTASQRYIYILYYVHNKSKLGL